MKERHPTMDRERSGLFWYIAISALVVCATAVTCILVLWISSAFGTGPIREAYMRLTGTSEKSIAERAGTPRRKLIVLFRQAFRRYEVANGQLPYDPAGSDTALYDLRDYLDSAELYELAPNIIFDCPNGVVLECPYIYVNRADLSTSNGAPHMVILAEKDESGTNGRWLLCLDGSAVFVTSASPLVGDLLGSDETIRRSNNGENGAPSPS